MWGSEIEQLLEGTVLKNYLNEKSEQNYDGPCTWNLGCNIICVQKKLIKVYFYIFKFYCESVQQGRLQEEASYWNDGKKIRHNLIQDKISDKKQ